MTWQPPTSSFTVNPPNGWNDVALPTKAPWALAAPVPIETGPPPEWQSDENLKKALGVALAKLSSFEAVRSIAGEDSLKAQWMHVNWLCDPVVVASKDAYLKTLELSQPPLDKAQLAAKVLALVDEKVISPKTGQSVPSIEAKDRIAALKLYSDIMGYTGKVEIDASTNSITHNEMTIKLVRPEVKETKVLEASNIKNPQSTITNDVSPITLKLVGASR